MATLGDVAREAGVSTATVSHVVNGTRFVTEATASRVREAILATGFRPNPVARALRTATTQTIGFIASDISNPFSSAVIKGVESASRRAHHTLLVANSADDPELEAAAIDSLEERRIDGMVIALTAQAPEDTLERLARSNLPVVLLDRSADAPADQVLVDNEQPTAHIVGRLLDSGHERVAIIAGDSRHTSITERVAGWRQAHAVRGLEVDECLVAYCTPRANDAQRMTEELLKAVAPPTAFFATTSTMAQGVYRAAQRMARRIPEDFSLVAFDDFEWADILQPPLTCLAQPAFQMGEEAIRLLLERIAQPERAPVVLRLAPELRVRASAPALRI